MDFSDVALPLLMLHFMVVTWWASFRRERLEQALGPTWTWANFLLCSGTIIVLGVLRLAQQWYELP